MAHNMKTKTCGVILAILIILSPNILSLSYFGRRQDMIPTAHADVIYTTALKIFTPVPSSANVKEWTSTDWGVTWSNTATITGASDLSGYVSSSYKNYDNETIVAWNERIYDGFGYQYANTWFREDHDGNTSKVDEPTPDPLKPVTPLGMSFQRHTFRDPAYNRYFMFYYSNASGFVFRNSLDGLTWSDETSFHGVEPMATGENFAIAFSEISHKVCYVVTPTLSYGNKSYWRWGTVQSGGSITWYGSENELEFYGCERFCNIAMDSDDNIWISLITEHESPYAYWFEVWTNALGTMEQAYERQIYADAFYDSYSTFVPFTDGKIGYITCESNVGTDGYSHLRYIESADGGYTWHDLVNQNITSSAFLGGAVAYEDKAYVLTQNATESMFDLVLYSINYDDDAWSFVNNDITTVAPFINALCPISICENIYSETLVTVNIYAGDVETNWFTDVITKNGSFALTTPTTELWQVGVSHTLTANETATFPNATIYFFDHWICSTDMTPVYQNTITFTDFSVTDPMTFSAIYVPTAPIVWEVTFDYDTLDNVDGSTNVLNVTIGLNPIAILTKNDLPITYTDIPNRTTIIFGYRDPIPSTISGEQYNFVGIDLLYIYEINYDNSPIEVSFNITANSLVKAYYENSTTTTTTSTSTTTSSDGSGDGDGSTTTGGDLTFTSTTSSIHTTTSSGWGTLPPIIPTATPTGLDTLPLIQLPEIPEELKDLDWLSIWGLLMWLFIILIIIFMSQVVYKKIQKKESIRESMERATKMPKNIWKEKKK